MPNAGYNLTGSSGVINVAPSGNLITWDATTTSPGITQATPASDVATQNITITSQAPFASASTNKTPGDITINKPSPLSGGRVFSHNDLL